VKGASILELPPDTHKARDFAIGFFGWLLIWNLIFFIFLFYYFNSLWVIGVLLILGISLPFLSRKNWLGFGVVTCVITNMVAWIAIATTNFQIFMIVTPFPMGLLFM